MTMHLPMQNNEMFYLSQKLIKQCIFCKTYERTIKEENKISKLKIYKLFCKVLWSPTKISEKKERKQAKNQTNY